MTSKKWIHNGLKVLFKISEVRSYYQNFDLNEQLTISLSIVARLIPTM